jgi:hypothetical protein
MKLDKKMWDVFVHPKKIYYLGKLIYGTPYFYPWNFNSTILTVRKNRPKFLRCKYFKLFGYEISYGWPIYIYWHGLGWKDKFNSPRFEWNPSFYVFIFRWQFVIKWCAPDGDNDKYFEMILWYHDYCNDNIVQAEKTWPWVADIKNNKSTWNKNYLIAK